MATLATISERSAFSVDDLIDIEAGEWFPTGRTVAELVKAYELDMVQRSDLLQAHTRTAGMIRANPWMRANRAS